MIYYVYDVIRETVITQSNNYVEAFKIWTEYYMNGYTSIDIARDRSTNSVSDEME